MKRIFLLMLIISAYTSNAQVQFWNSNDVENEQWAPFYAAQKVKQVTVYQTDEFGKRLGQNEQKSIRVYDRQGKQITSQNYKYNYRTGKNELQSADSSFYNDKGQLIRFSSYEGPNNRKTYEVIFVYDAKGRQSKQLKYSMQDYQLTKEGEDVFTYGAGAGPVKLVSKNTPSVLDHTRQFTYDKQGRLTQAIFSSDGSSITTAFARNEKNQLIDLKEMNGKDLSKEIKYTYDDAGRRVKKSSGSSTGYFDQTTYTYKEKNMLPSSTYLFYPGSGGKTDLRHEYMEFVYEFY